MLICNRSKCSLIDATYGECDILARITKPEGMCWRIIVAATRGPQQTCRVGIIRIIMTAGGSRSQRVVIGQMEVHYCQGEDALG